MIPPDSDVVQVNLLPGVVELIWLKYIESCDQIK